MFHLAYGTVVLCLLLLLVASSDRHVHGIVRDGTDNTPLAGVVVLLDGQKIGGITDHHGEFHIHLPEHVLGSDTICVVTRRLGYRTDTTCAVAEADFTIVLQRADVSAEAVSVIGERLPAGTSTQATHTIGISEQDEHRGQTLADVLNRLPGVTALRTGAAVAKPVVHGVTGQRIVTSNNGVALEGQQWGEDHGPEVDPFTPMVVHLVKGPSSVQYGPGAMGGVIHLQPVPLLARSGISGAITTNLFMNNVQGAIGGWVQQGGLFDAPVALRLYGGVRKAGDMRSSSYALDNTGFEQYTAGALAQIGEESDGPSATVLASVFDATLGVFTASHTGNVDDLQRAIASDTPLVAAGDRYSIEPPRQEVNHSMFIATGTLPMPNVGDLTLRWGYQQNYRNEYDRHNTRIVGRGTDSIAREQDSIARLQASLTSPAISLLLSTYNLDVAFKHRDVGPFMGSVGVSGLRQANSRGGSVALIPDYVMWGLSGFIHEQWVMQHISFSAGVRYDVRWLEAWPESVIGDPSPSQHRIFGGLSGGLGMMWQANEALNLRVNLAQAWRQPNVNELYSNGVHHGAARYEIGDSLLGVERMTGADFSVEFQTEQYWLEATAHASMYRGFIQPLPDPENPTITVRGTFPTFRYEQLDALIMGLDVDGSVTLVEPVDVLLQLAVVYGQDQTHNEPLFLMPANRIRVATHIHGHDVLGLENVYAEIGVLGVGTQNRYVPDQDYAPPPPGYVLCDIQMGGTVDFLGTFARWSVGITNLFNSSYRDYLSRYRYYADDAGRDVIFRFTIPFGDQP